MLAWSAAHYPDKSATDTGASSAWSALEAFAATGRTGLVADKRPGFICGVRSSDLGDRSCEVAREMIDECLKLRCGNRDLSLPQVGASFGNCLAQNVGYEA